MPCSSRKRVVRSGHVSHEKGFLGEKSFMVVHQHSPPRNLSFLILMIENNESDVHDPNYAVTSLIKAAKHAGSLDNITAIVVFLTAPSDIVARSSDANSVLVVKSMKNMAVNNPYVQKDLSDGMFFKQMKQYQQQHQQPYDNDQEERHANGSEETAMDDGGFHDEITGGGADGKHEENDAADYIYEDLGPETDVDAVDDVDNADNLDNLDNVHENPLLDNVPAIAANLSDGIFLEGKNMPKCDENNFQEKNAALDVTLETTLDDDDSPANNDINFVGGVVEIPVMLRILGQESWPEFDASSCIPTSPFVPHCFNNSFIRLP
ncbi:putative threonine-rich GPI-anchored glycoprotein PJ466402-like isoform X2 [Vespula squamosa]|uniref:Threonine-rich GPI-anchored glycoprotein PJ466402-like isoform X2 n=1 Tax=Vespula squamosa TaxID=30214 RepID=A0ABD2C6E9_VESSQ